jgi:hypothetical protein
MSAGARDSNSIFLSAWLLLPAGIGTLNAQEFFIKDDHSRYCAFSERRRLGRSGPAFWHGIFDQPPHRHGVKDLSQQDGTRSGEYRADAPYVCTRLTSTGGGYLKPKFS